MAFSVTEASNSFHVAPEGADTANGTKAQPFRTIQKALDEARPGDTVLLHNGVYRETIRPPRSGSEGKPITITSAEGESAIIAATETLAGPWIDQGDGVFTTTVLPEHQLYRRGILNLNISSGLDQFFLNGTALVEARHPNKKTADLLDHDGATVTLEDTYQSRSDDWDGFPDDFFKNARFLGRIYPQWSSQNGIVQSSSGNTLQIDSGSVSVPWWPNRSKQASSHGAAFVYGTLNLLDTAGEWHLETISSTEEKLHLRLPPDSHPQGLLIERKTRPWCIQIENRSHIIIRGLQLRGGAVLLEGNQLVLENCYIRYPTHFLTFKDGYSRNGGILNGSGVVIKGNGNVVQRCLIRESAGSGISIEGNGNLVARNLIRDMDYSGTYAAAIHCGGSGNLVEFNTLQDTGRDGITVSGNGHGIFYNHLRRAGRLALDVGLIYSYGQNGMGPRGNPTRIAYNWAHESGNPQDTRTRGIYLDNYSRNFVVDHNVIWDLGPADANRGLHVNAPAENIAFYHNTLIGVRPATMQTYSKYPLANTDKEYWTEWKNHLFYSHQNNLHIPSTIDPNTLLEDPANGDFRPQENHADPELKEFTVEWETADGKTGVPQGFIFFTESSNLLFKFREQRGSGVRIEGINDAFTGKTPDNGAYERGLPLWRPGHQGWATMPE